MIMSGVNTLEEHNSWSNSTTQYIVMALTIPDINKSIPKQNNREQQRGKKVNNERYENLQ
jgi:hypothetical protein